MTRYISYLFGVLLRLFYRTQRAQVRRKFCRVLPLGELAVDRNEKAQSLGFGAGASIYDSAIIFGDVYVGEHSWVGPQVVLDGAAAPVCVGSWCSISAGVHVYSHDSVAWAVTGGKASYPSAPVIIGDRVYVGPLTVISKGVRIGDGCVIGANSFVMHDIPAGCAAWGNPARITGRVLLQANGEGYTIVPADSQ